MCQNCSDPEMAERRHGFKPVNPRGEDEAYDRMRDREVMKKVYMVCDYTNSKASAINGTPHIGVERMGNCGGRILREDGSEIGRHHSSSFGWLRSDLRLKLDVPTNYEIVDLIGQSVPERFQLRKKIEPDEEGGV